MSIFNLLSKQVGHAKRYRQIVGVLVKYGFEDLLAYLDEGKRYSFLKSLVPKSTYKHATELSRYERMRMVCEELGPSFTKFGQVLSNRPDLLPEGLIKELEKLQDTVPPFPGKTAVSIIEKELDSPVSELFSAFDEVPLASASIAQVHRAELKDGTKVVVKVQRPNIHETIESDVEIMLAIARTLEENFERIRSFEPVKLVKTYRESIRRELDFVHESINLERFQINDNPEQNIYVPKVYPSLTTEKVLTLEYIDGIKVSNALRLKEEGYDVEEIVDTIVKSFFRQVFDRGFFHADPHSGNIIVMPNNQVCFVDFGMMGNIIKKDVDLLVKLLLGIEEKNTKSIVKSLLSLSDQVHVDNYRELEYEVYELVHSYANLDYDESRLSSLFLELKDIILRNKLKVPVHFFFLTKAIISLEGLVHHLSPNYDIYNPLKIFLIKHQINLFNPVLNISRILHFTRDMSAYLEDLPTDLKQTLLRLKSGHFDVNIEHKGVEPILKSIKKVTSRIVTAVIAAGLLIGSSLLFVADIEPKWHDKPVIGIIGLAIGGFLSLRLLWGIWRNG